MEAATSPRAEHSLFAPAIVIAVCLVLIFLSLLGIGNEIRYQGCVARIDEQKLIAATQNPRNPAPVVLGCDRIPFK